MLSLTNILSIQPRRVDFRTQTNADWIDGLLVYGSGDGGIESGPTNIGNGALTIASVDASTLLGAHVVVVTSLQGVTRFSVTDPSGSITAEGVAGLPVYAAGITFTLAQGATSFAVGDTFAIGVLPVPIDITDIGFDMQVRASATTPTIVLTATSHPDDDDTDQTLVTGGEGGQLALRVLQPAMAASRFAPGSYVYDILASADGLTVPAFFGTITHVDGVTRLPI